MQKFSTKIQAYSHAWATQQDHSEKKNIDSLYFNSFCRNLADTIGKESKLELQYLIKKYLISEKAIKPEERLTISKLKYYFMSKNIPVPKFTTKLDLIGFVADQMPETHAKVLVQKIHRKLIEEQRQLV